MRSSPFISIDKQAVIGTLKATGSIDPDVLYAARAKLIGAVAMPRLWGAALLVGSLAAGWSRIGFLAVVLVVAGWWFVHRGSRNVRMVEAGYAEYAATLQATQSSGNNSRGAA